MRVKHLRLGQRSDDGDLPVEMVLCIDNNGALEGRSVAVSAVLVDGAGFPVAETLETDTSISVAPGERLEWALPEWAVPAGDSRAGAVPAGVRASGVLRAKEVLRLGVFEVPAEPGAYRTLSKRVSSESLDPEVKVTLWRRKPDSDRQSNVSCVASFRNRLDHAIDVIDLKADLLGSDEEPIDSRIESESAMPGRSTCINGSTNWVDDVKLPGASVRLSLVVHRTIGRWRCESRVSA